MTKWLASPESYSKLFWAAWDLLWFARICRHRKKIQCQWPSVVVVIAHWENDPTTIPQTSDTAMFGLDNGGKMRIRMQVRPCSCSQSFYIKWMVSAKHFRHLATSTYFQINAHESHQCPTLLLVSIRSYFKAALRFDWFFKSIRKLVSFSVSSCNFMRSRIQDKTETPFPCQAFGRIYAKL